MTEGSNGAPLRRPRAGGAVAGRPGTDATRVAAQLDLDIEPPAAAHDEIEHL